MLRFLIPLALLATSANAEPRLVVLRQALICDTVEQVQETVQDLTLQSKEAPKIDGCGMLQSPAQALAEPVMVFETNHAYVLVMRFTFLGALGVQYGYGAFQPKPPQLSL